MHTHQIQEEIAKRDFAIGKEIHARGRGGRAVDQLAWDRAIADGRGNVGPTWRDYIFIIQEA